MTSGWLEAIGGVSTLANTGLAGIVSATVYMLLSGRLVPRSTVEDVRADRDARLIEVGHQFERLKEINAIWEQTSKTNEDARRILEDHLGKVIAEKQQQADALRDLAQVVKTIQDHAEVTRDA